MLELDVRVDAAGREVAVDSQPSSLSLSQLRPAC